MYNIIDKARKRAGRLEFVSDEGGWAGNEPGGRVRDLLFTKQSIYSYGRFSLFDHSEIIATGVRGRSPPENFNKIRKIKSV